MSGAHENDERTKGLITGVLAQEAKMKFFDLKLSLEVENPKTGQTFLAAGLRKNYNLEEQKQWWQKLFPKKIDKLTSKDIGSYHYDMFNGVIASAHM